MMHLLAQTGGGGGSWLNPATVRVLAILGFLLISAIGSIVKKANEQRQKRQAELARDRREEEALRTGRPAADLSDTGEFEAIRDNTPSQPARQATAEDARRKLQELAERRRRELAEMMRRAQQGSGAATPPSPTTPSSATSLPAPPTMAPPSGPLPRPRPQPQQPKPRPQQNQPRRSPNPQQQPRSMQEVEARRRDDAQAQREGANQSAARGRAEDAETTRREAIARIAKGAPGAPTDSAYDLPGARRAETASAAVSGASVGAAMARVGAGAKTASAAERRKAIVLSELLHRPVGMREDGERAL